MTGTEGHKLRRSAVHAFMAFVTIGLLALSFSQEARGAPGWAEVVVYSFAAGFGLEFLGSAWVASSFAHSRHG